MLTAIAYCLYCEELFAILKRRRSGCWVGSYYCGIFGYSDDNWVLAPSLSALQDVLCTLEEYAKSHNLKFSTDPNPNKCKTKCMAFLRKVRDLPKLVLCGNTLPWVDTLTHLGTKVTNKIDGCQDDLKMKTATYIQKNCSIIQEFNFAHPITKLRLNSIYNCHFSGSALWDLFSQSMRSFESTFNRSVKMMTDLPFETHRYFFESLLGTPHMKLRILKNYLTFIKSIKMSSKQVLRHLYTISSSDVRSITGKKP